MIKSRMLFLIGCTMLILFSLSAGSLALFTSEAISSGNAITTGTMYIGNQAGERGILDKFITLENIIPGSKPHKIKLKIKNLGTMTTYIKGLSAVIKENDHKFIANAIQTHCHDAQGRELYKGSLLALDGNVMPMDRVVTLQPGKTTELEVSIQLDERAGNWYKEKKIELSFSVYAFQREDQKLDNRTLLATEKNVQQTLDQAELGDVVMIPAGDHGNLTLKPGVIAKAKDVVFDTIVEEFHIKPFRIADNTIKDHGNKVFNDASGVQGFTIKKGVEIYLGKEFRITDNIFISSKRVIVNRGGHRVFATRNDLSYGLEDQQDTRLSKEKRNDKRNARSDKLMEGKVEAGYNLGDDLDPEKHAQ
ncbi:MAG: hypothetical protein AB1341_09430 [Bacillota bacterium]|nr:hypothetical protein [Gammaproteobacteria bacterium]